MDETLYNGKKRGAVIRTVSLTQEDDALCNELNISLSGILRAKIQEIRDNSSNYNKLLLEKDEKIQKLVKEVQELYVILEKKDSK